MRKLKKDGDRNQTQKWHNATKIKRFTRKLIHLK